MAEKAAETVRKVLGGFNGVPEEVRNYAADTAAGLLDDMKVILVPFVRAGAFVRVCACARATVSVRL